jgi:hypothetical protein
MRCPGAVCKQVNSLNSPPVRPKPGEGGGMIPPKADGKLRLLIGRQ